MHQTMELGYAELAQGTQSNFSIQGYDLAGILLFMSDESYEDQTYITVRTPQTTLVERIRLDYLHQISDYYRGNSFTDTAASGGYVFIDLNMLSLADDEEMSIAVDYVNAQTGIYVGVAAVIHDIPPSDEKAYHYQIHTDTSFSTDAASALFAFKSSIVTAADLVTMKLGDDTRSTTLRAAGWYANCFGDTGSDVNTMAVLIDGELGQPMTLNTAASGVTFICRRIHQPDARRSAAVTKRIGERVVRKLHKLDPQSLKAV